MTDARCAYLDHQPLPQASADQLSRGDWKAALEGWWAAWHPQGRLHLQRAGDSDLISYVKKQGNLI